jgi:starch synthase
MKYGTIPIVRATGGLADTFTPVGSPTGPGTGFVFRDYTPEAFLQVLHEVLEAYKDQKLWHRIRQNAMGQDFSWTKSAQAYLKLCRQLI